MYTYIEREGESELKNELVYKKDSFKQDMLCDPVVTKSNGFFKDLRRSECITEKELKYFSCEYKKVANFNKRLGNVTGRPVISNYVIPTEKVSEFLDYHRKPVMESGRSYIKDSGDFLKKIKNLDSFPENAILVTADVVGLYPSIPNKAGLKALEETLENRNQSESVPKTLKPAAFLVEF